MIQIGLVQAASCRDVLKNLQTLRQYTAAAAQAGCEVVCFPEYFLTGYVPEEAEDLALREDAPVFQEVLRIAAGYAIDILVGYMENSDEAFYITHGLFRRDGTFGKYRKTHPGQREKRFFSSGDTLCVLTLTGGTQVGIQLCVETHYPQITQTLALRGAKIIFAPHAVPRVSGDRQAIWSKYIPARSYDNRVYMACCNQLDPEYYGGGCLVTGPRGEIAASCFDDSPALLTCQVDTELLDSFRSPDSRRSRHFYPALQRKELYE